MPIQIINTELVGLLESHFQPRYDSAFAWKSAVSAFLAIPGLIAFWPMSALRRDSSVNEVRDLAGGAYHLNATNVPTFGYSNLVPYGAFDGVNQYLTRADGGAADWADVRGTETQIIAAQRGLTIGGWFYCTTVAAAMTALAKWTTASADRSYALEILTAPATPRFAISVDGIASTTVTSSITLSTAAWYFLVGRFDPSTELAIFVNDTKDTNAVAIPASIFDSIAAFTIAARATPGNYLDGRASMCFPSFNLLSDSIIFSLFHQTRAMFGV